MSTLAVTIGGIPFRPVDDRLIEKLSPYMPSEDLPDVMTPRGDWPGPNLLGLGLPILPPPGYRVGLGCFWYPWGMSRFGVYRGIISATDVDSLGVIVSGAPETALPFKMLVDGGGVETDLYVLPPRPLVSPPGTSSSAVPKLYLVTLVDDRFYRQGYGGGNVRINSTDNTTWGDLITALASALGITLMSASVDAAYFRPEPDSFLYSNEESAAALLDAVAANVGRVVVRNLDGTYKLQTYADTNTAAKNSRYQSDSTTQPFRARMWGGAILPTDTAASTWRPMVVPEPIVVTFPKWVTGDGYYEPTNYRQYAKASYGDIYKKTLTLSDLGSPYSTWTSGPGIKIIRLPAKAEFAVFSDPTPTNDTDVTTLAKRVAKDFLDSVIGSLDESYQGIVNRSPDGACDVLWCVRGNELGDPPTVFTRVTRRPFEYGASYRQNGLAALTIPVPPPPPAGTAPAVYAIAALGGSPPTFTVRQVHRNGSGVLTDDTGPVEYTAYEAQSRDPWIDTPGSPTREYPLEIDSAGKYYFQIDQYTDGSATPALAGQVSTTTQVIKGAKEFLDTTYHDDSIFVFGSITLSIDADKAFFVPGSASGMFIDGSPIIFQTTNNSATTNHLSGSWGFRNDGYPTYYPLPKDAYFWQSSGAYAVTGLVQQSPPVEGPMIGISTFVSVYDFLKASNVIYFFVGGILVGESILAYGGTPVDGGGPVPIGTPGIGGAPIVGIGGPETGTAGPVVGPPA